MKKKILVIFIGLLAVLMFLEIGIRVYGFIYNNYYNPTNSNNVNSDKIKSYKILTIGNSFTYGVGAPYGHSYPLYLERELHKQVKNIRVRVYNRAICGANSAMMLRKLEDYIQETNPELIILRTGQMNRTTNYLINDYLIRDKIASTQYLQIVNLIHEKLFNLRVYRLFSYIMDSFEMRKIKNQIDDTTIGQWFDQGTKYMNKINDYEVNGYYSASEKEISELTNWLHGEFKINPHPYYFYCLGRVAEKRYRNYVKAQKLYSEGIKYDQENARNINYKGLVALKHKINDGKLLKEINDFIYSWGKQYPDNAYLFKIYDDNDDFWDQWVRSDLTEMIRIITKYHIKIVMHNYPPSYKFDIARLKINQLLREVASANNIVFLDLEMKFIELMKRYGSDEEFIKEYYAFDEPSWPMRGHLNSKGYKMNAKYLFEMIMKNKMLDKL